MCPEVIKTKRPFANYSTLTIDHSLTKSEFRKSRLAASDYSVTAYDEAKQKKAGCLCCYAYVRSRSCHE
uniref:Uncharacterized protein n=1 Tax=Utricularia reniformis TaxID=192314 RepID=A0A1Y0B408_9LAMI|nr:hypothetical protein AEK19_MT1988 [Utricularia reniformis]ART32151.1 hypothetical protein AEK19_MT1988 [Utricularia reniformis]